MDVLSINVGSSSLKLDLWDLAAGQRVFGEDARSLRLSPGAEPREHVQALEDLLRRLEAAARRPIARVGHRIVHGGARYTGAVRLDAPVLTELDGLVPLSPVHLPPALAVVRRARALLPQAVHVAVFDTAFHAGLPPRAREYALPQRWRRQGVRRYGFHGLACEDVVAQLGADLRPRAVILHLGAGCSATAVRDGRSVDTTMGLTPLEGLAMATRSGDVDPGALTYLLRQGETPATLDRGLNHESGLLGLSGVSGDMRTLWSRREEPDVALALEVFCYRAAKAVGALAVALGGLDQLIFSGGIGEHAEGVRAAVSGQLAWLGLVLDVEANAAHAPRISTPGSAVAVHVVRIDESRAIAQRAAGL